MRMQLPDGTFIEDIPDDTPEDALKNLHDRGVAMIEEKAQARTPLNRAKRMGIEAGLGTVDFVSDTFNYGPNKILFDKFREWKTGKPSDVRIPHVTPWGLEQSNTPELPADADWKERLAEGAGSAAIGGLPGLGRGIVMAGVRNLPGMLGALARFVGGTTANVAGGEGGGVVGQQVAEAVGADPQKGKFWGSFVGGQSGATAAGRVPLRGLEANLQRKYGSPEGPEIYDAGERVGVEPSFGSLANERGKNVERYQGAQVGSAGVVQQARQNMLDQLRIAGHHETDAIGATDPRPDVPIIGEQGTALARDVRDTQTARVKGRQDAMERHIGHDAPVNIEDVVNASLELHPDARLPHSVDINSHNALAPHIDNLLRMARVDPQTGRLVVDYSRFKDWRAGLGQHIEGAPDIPTPVLDHVLPIATGSMRTTAAQRGVAGNVFDDVQRDYSVNMGAGGLSDRLTDYGGRETRAGNVVGGKEAGPSFEHLETSGANPQRLRDLVNVPPGANSPLVARGQSLFADLIRRRIQETLGRDGGLPIQPNEAAQNRGGAAGPRQFSDWWHGDAPTGGVGRESRQLLGGPNQQGISDIATLARAINYPTAQTGGTSMVRRAIPALAPAAIGGILGSIVKPGVGTAVGTAIGGGLPIAKRAIHSRILQGDVGTRALGGRRTGLAPSLSDLIQGMILAEEEQQQ